MEPVIAVEKLSFSYPDDVKALQDVSLQIAEGEFVGITGPAGAGKSTLVLCLNGIIPHFQDGSFQGRVLINNHDTFETTCAELSRQIGSVFQDPEAQLVAPTVEEELAFGLENLAIAPAEMERRISQSLELIGISHLRLRSTQELSGGQKQRVSIAAAIALQPQILILDEPTSELDPIGTMEVFEVLQKLNRELHLTIIVVEQKINILMEYVSRLFILQNGVLLSDLAPREIINKPDLLKNIGLMAPPVSQLAYRLKAAGLYRAELPLTVDEAYLGIMRSFPKIERNR